MNGARKQAHPAGFGLVEVLVVIVLLAVLAVFLFPRLAGRGKGSVGQNAATARQRAQQTVGITYISQINQAIAMYRMDSNGQNPPNLQALKRYNVTDEMLLDPVTKQPLAYNPSTGTVRTPGGTGLTGAGRSVPGL